MLGVVTLIAWVAWLLATLSIFTELVGALGGQRMRMPGTEIFAPASAVLVTAILGLAASSTVATAHLDIAAQSVPVASSMAVEDAQFDQVAADSQSRSDVKVHIVQPGEDLWTLAERYFGDGMRWRELAALNDTTLLNPTAPLQAGMQLFVPITEHSGTAAQGSRPAELPAEQAVDADVDQARFVDVQPGDSLWVIAERELGDGAAWPQLAEANQDVVGDPDVIDVGWRLRVPGVSSSTEAVAGDGLGRATGEGDPANAQTANQPQKPTGGERPTEPSISTHEQHPPVTNPSSGGELDAPTGQQSDGRDVESPSVASVRVAVASVAGISVTLAATIVAALRLRRGRQLAQLPVGHRLSFAQDRASEVGSALLALADQDEDWGPRRLNYAQPESELLRVRLGEMDDEQVWLDLGEAAWTILAGDREESLGLATSVVLQLMGEDNPVRVIAAGAGFEWLASLDEPRLTTVSTSQARQMFMHLLSERGDAQIGADQLAVLQRDPDTAEAWAETLFVFDSDPLLEGYQVAELRKLGVTLLVCAPPAQLDLDGQQQPAGPVPLRSANMVTVGQESAQLADGTEFIADHVSAPARRALSELFESATEVDFEPAAWWSDEPPAASNVISINQSSVFAPAPWKGAGSPQRLEPQLPISTQTTQPTMPQANTAGSKVPLATESQLGVSTATTSELGASTATASTPAPSGLFSAHPFVKLLGPVELVGTRGERPTRAAKQCAEYCAWLMEHPGASAPQMTRSLLVAETTRRSNMSRLRTWLGSDEQGAPYLPEAYSGRIHLHPAVSSDWEQFGLLLSAGVNRASDDALRHALDMVRGAPLADAAPGQWHWAEQLRADMAAMIRDAAYVLASRELANNQYDSARWAANRGLLASAEDERLLGVKLLIEHRCGNHLEVDRLVLHITRQARILGVDLMDETVTLLQEVVEGQARSRMA